MTKFAGSRLIDGKRCRDATAGIAYTEVDETRLDVCRRRRWHCPCEDKAYNQRIITHIDRLIFVPKKCAANRCGVVKLAKAAPVNRSVYRCAASAHRRSPGGLATDVLAASIYLRSRTLWYLARTMTQTVLTVWCLTFWSCGLKQLEKRTKLINSFGHFMLATSVSCCWNSITFTMPTIHFEFVNQWQASQGTCPSWEGLCPGGRSEPKLTELTQRSNVRE